MLLSRPSFMHRKGAGEIQRKQWLKAPFCFSYFFRKLSSNKNKIRIKLRLRKRWWKKKATRPNVLCTTLYLYLHGGGLFFKKKETGALEALPFKSRLAKRLGRQPRIVPRQNRLPLLSVWQRTSHARMLRLRYEGKGMTKSFQRKD